MRYMGGKFRQSKAIVEVLRPYVTSDTVYVESFCGGMWSAARVAKELKPGLMILNDINKPLMLLWEKCLKEGSDWLPTDAELTEREYPRYKSIQDDDDPLTAWYGTALSFGGKWFGGLARGCNNKGTRRNYAEEICNQPKVGRMKSPVVPLQIQPRIYPDFKKNRKGV